ncbi:hypothetical protein AGDE_13642 [Angomonas deanei]|nr:hypothetical protein AGDE_13642 [Angomonas deanei]|eukprot:EPY21946.1 hypothetical protein AGDE_13642 [Angomonas deanei]
MNQSGAYPGAGDSSYARETSVEDKTQYRSSTNAVATTSTGLVPYNTSGTVEVTTAQTMTPAWEEGETIANQKEDMLIYGPLAKPITLPQVEQDLMNEILALNTSAMEKCREGILDLSVLLLEEALYKLNPDLNEDPYAIILSDQQLCDQLTATTLNNMGVVESHRGRPREALRQFEGARELENNWNIASPSVSVNMCAAYNALGQYDRASAAALETIDMLRELEVQRRAELRLKKRLGAHATLTDEELAVVEEEDRAELEAAANRVRVSDIENAALWGAAWHNLGVAQVNTVRANIKKSNTNAKGDSSEVTNALKIMQNAMKATQDLLGLNHPMTQAVTETYRAVRKTLREGGAYKQHRNLMTQPLPPVDPCEREALYRTTQPMHGSTRQRTIQKQQKDLTVTFRGEGTKQEKFIERVTDEAYPSSFKQRSRSNQRGEQQSTTRGDVDASYSQKKRTTSKKSKNSRSVPKSLTGTAEIYGSSAGSSKRSSTNPVLRGSRPLRAGEKEQLFPSLNTVHQHMSESRPHGQRGMTPPLTASNSSTPPTQALPPPPPHRPTSLPATGNRKKVPDTTVEEKPPVKQNNNTNTSHNSSVLGGEGDSAKKREASVNTTGHNTFTESSRFLLLAQSPKEGSTAPATGSPGKVDMTVQTDDLPPSKEAFVPYDVSSSHDTSQRGEVTPTNSDRPTNASSHPPRELFDAMWVSAEDKYISKGNRSFGTPAYYVPDIEGRSGGSRKSSVLVSTAAGTPMNELSASSDPTSAHKKNRSSLMVYDESDGNTVFIQAPPSPSHYREL